MKQVISDRIRDISKLVKDRLDRDLKKPTFIKNFNQARIIAYLNENDDKKIYQKDLCDALKLKKSSITEHLDYLERIDVIKRISETEDKRKKYIVLGDKTMKMKKEFSSTLDEINKDLIKGISKKELDAFNLVLDKMERNLK